MDTDSDVTIAAMPVGVDMVPVVVEIEPPDDDGLRVVSFELEPPSHLTPFGITALVMMCEQWPQPDGEDVTVRSR